MYPKYHIRGNYHRNAPTLLASFGGNAVAVSSFERAPLCVLEAKQDAEIPPDVLPFVGARLYRGLAASRGQPFWRRSHHLDGEGDQRRRLQRHR